jgi:putative ABC transport system substrate-binding protein
LKVADGDPSRIAPLVTEVIASKVDVLFAIGPAVVRAARSATQTLPIIANDLETDPVDTGRCPTSLAFQQLKLSSPH